MTFTFLNADLLQYRLNPALGLSPIISIFPYCTVCAFKRGCPPCFDYLVAGTEADVLSSFDNLSSGQYFTNKVDIWGVNAL